MYSIFYKGREYEADKDLYLKIGICVKQFKDALIVDKHLFINLFKEKYVPLIKKLPPFDYSRLRDEELEGVIDTTPIVAAYEKEEK